MLNTYNRNNEGHQKLCQAHSDNDIDAPKSYVTTSSGFVHYKDLLSNLHWTAHTYACTMKWWGN